METKTGSGKEKIPGGSLDTGKSHAGESTRRDVSCGWNRKGRRREG